jgi:hypothetical protein
VAVYFLRSKHISRSNGSRATRAAAYRAGERIRNEATSEVFDHSSRRDISYKEVVLPADLTGRADMAWTQDRSILWNAAEHAGFRCNSRLAREWLVFLPPELAPDQRQQLVQSFARDLADRYRAAVDVCVHQPRTGADPRNHHAHLLMTTREVTPDGLGARTRLEISGRERYLKGIPGSSRDDYLAVRARWAELTNVALERAGLLHRVDHRSLKDRGIDREPTPTIPEKVWYAEKVGRFSAAGNEIRARHRERLEARSVGPETLANVLQKQSASLKAGIEVKQKRAQDKGTHFGSLTREERNAYRRENYRRRRELEATDPAAAEKRRAAGRSAYHLQMQKNPEAVRAARGRYRAENSEDVNRKQREYRRKNADFINEKRRDRRNAKAAAVSGNRTPTVNASANGAKASAMRWKAHRAQQGARATAAESAERWKKFREEQKRRESDLVRRQKPPQRDGIDSGGADQARPRRRENDLER